ncbi:helix-turn-helix domain-containing protein [Candidatus Enterococcus ferrettii]|uniref:HTH cro/C1-type domain-containing protein n=1 Tax=Candidatus Enterococcus ferrettii TaxID=2815324 RepID=A0ABV0EI45_9ENTE|nr:helix-turn-helix domain-containing protein [Enterococcus sp. 665A]MBO1341847.1 hypothetical protein [Enterococcus sp. 665A]
MPSTDEGRQKILRFLEERDISIRDLAAVYGLTPQDLTNYLNGKLKNKKSNQVVLQIISDYKIR